jgi:hypothetical protein
MSSNKSGRILVAATLAAALFLAVPVQAIDGRGAALGPLERLVAWFVETWLSAETAGATATAEQQGESGESQPPPPDDEEEHPRNCYTACVDPNG